MKINTIAINAPLHSGMTVSNFQFRHWHEKGRWWLLNILIWSLLKTSKPENYVQVKITTGCSETAP